MRATLLLLLRLLLPEGVEALLGAELLPLT